MPHPIRFRSLLAPAGLVALAACSGTTTIHHSSPAPAPEAVEVVRLDIPPGHLPPPGKCRIWIPGNPPGHQPKARRCAGIEADAPAGSWIVYRPSKDRRVVHVRLIDERRPGVIVRIRVFDLDGRLIGDEPV